MQLSHVRAATAVLAVVMALLLRLVPASGIEDETWSATINVAGNQRMLSQRMSKEFFLVVQGVDTETNRAALQRSIGEFQEALDCLLAGCPTLSIVAAPNPIIKEGLQNVLNVWQPFAALLEGISGVVGPPLLEELLRGSLELLRHSNTVVERLIDAAQAGGAPTIGQAVNIVQRQRTLVQRMCKELCAVGLGVLAVESLANLRETWSTFHDSHEGLLLGAPWAGVPVLSRRCTLLVMREVSYEWERFKPLIGQVLAESTLQGSQRKAQELAKQVADQSEPLFAAVVAGVDSYISAPEDCKVVEPTSSEWFELLDKVGHQALLGQDTAHLFAEIAAGLEAESGQIKLISEIRAAEFDLRYLIQGDKARGLPSPPSQEIVDQLTAVHRIWQPMESLLLGAVGSVTIDPVVVHQVAAFSKRHYEATRRVAALYVEWEQNGSSSVNAPLVDLLELQRVLPAKMLKEATLIFAMEQAEENHVALNATRSLFTNTHWNLLLGANADATSGSPALEGTAHVCLVQQMKTVWDLFHSLETFALSMARGVEPAGLAEEHTLTRQMSEACAAVIHSYAALPAVPTCEPGNVTFLEWSSALQAFGALSALAERASIAHLLHHLQVPSASTDLTRSRHSLRWATLRLAFGSGPERIPAPWNQEILDHMRRVLLQHWQAFERLLEADQLELEAAGSGSRGSAAGSPEVLTAGLEVLAAVESTAAKYLAAAAGAEDPSNGAHLPLQRLHTAAQQSLWSHTAVKEALIARNGDQGAHEEMEIAFARFENAHHDLRHGGPDFPAIIPQRPDLLAQWSRVDELWPSFLQQVRALASGADNVPYCLQDLAMLGEELAAATALFALPDPFVPLEEPGFSFSALIYALWGVAMLAVVGAAAISSYYCRSRAQQRCPEDGGFASWSQEAV